MKKEDIKHVINYFKLLGLIIITCLLNVIKILAGKSSYMRDMLTYNSGEVTEYLIYSFLIYALGFVSWYIYECLKENRKNE